MARGTYRGVYSVLVDDPDFRRLSPPARHTLLTMRVSKEVGIACLWVLEPITVAKQTGLPLETVEGALGELSTSPSAARPWLYRDGDVAWLRNGLRHDPSTSLRSAPVRAHCLRVVSSLPVCALLRKFCRYYKLPYPLAKGHRTRIEAVSPPSPKNRRTDTPKNRTTEPVDGVDNSSLVAQPPQQPDPLLSQPDPNGNDPTHDTATAVAVSRFKAEWAIRHPDEAQP